MMVKSHTDMGSSPEEAQELANEHKKFEATAKVRWNSQHIHLIKLTVYSPI